METEPPPNPSLADGVDGERPGNELTVEQRVPSAGVYSIKYQRAVIRASAKELCQARQPRAAGPAKVELRPAPPETGDVVGREGPWSDCAHVAEKDVDELRHLIQASGPQQPAHSRHPAVAHRSEFQDLERAAPVSEPILAKEYGPTVIDQDRRHDQGHRRPKRRQSRGGPDEVEQPLRS